MNNKFLAGWMTSTAATSLYQDYYGMEGYIELCRNGWVDPNITVPLAIVLIILAIFIYNSKG